MSKARKDGRECISVTFHPELAAALRAAALAADQPLTVFCREAIKKQLERA